MWPHPPRRPPRCAYARLTSPHALTRLAAPHAARTHASPQLDAARAHVSRPSSYPLNVVGLREGILSSLGKTKEGEKTSVHVGLTLALMVLMNGAALFIKDLGLVVGLGGAILGSALVYIFPALMAIGEKAGAVRTRARGRTSTRVAAARTRTLARPPHARRARAAAALAPPPLSRRRSRAAARASRHHQLP
jgi:hypothetical protein